MIISGLDWLTLGRLSTWVLGVPLVACALTYLTSWLRATPAKPNTNKEPPTLPYWLPYLQHLPAFLGNPGALYETGRKQFSSSPFTLLLAGTQFHVFFSPETISHVFSRSRKFSFEPVMESMMENAVNLPMADRPRFSSSGGLPGQPKFVTENHNIWTFSLSGERLDDIMAIYISNFHKTLAERVNMHSSEWFQVNLYSFVRRLIFETSVLTFFGPRLQEVWGPSMWDDWRRYDEATYIGVRTNWAYSLQPGAYAARERMFQAFEKWLEAKTQNDWSDENSVWCEEWGFKMNWERDRLAKQNKFTFRGRASLQASFLFVIVTNAAPMASWFTFCAASTPERLALYRSAVLQTGDGHEGQHLDVGNLKQDPYIHGLWLEALRLGTASAAARVVMEEGTQLEGYIVRKGSVVLMPVQLMHFNKDVFERPHDVCPERWSTAGPDKLKRMHSTMRPFGGGTSLCSGRFVAEQEIIGVVSSLLLLFDVKFEQKEVQWKFNPRSIGVMAPKKDPVVHLRRRLRK